MVQKWSCNKSERLHFSAVITHLSANSVHALGLPCIWGCRAKEIAGVRTGLPWLLRRGYDYEIAKGIARFCMLKSICDFMSTEVPVTPCDLIFVLAGLPERKSYGLELFQRGVAPRLVLSVSRFDVRHTAALLAEKEELLTLRDQTSPEKRHFWIEFRNGRRWISRAGVQRTGTHGELKAIGEYLALQPPATIAFISTSIHLRRVRFCCSRIPFFQGRRVYFWAVPEEMSSFRRKTWWKHPAGWRYLLSEYAKLAGYRLMLG
jgi:hypothetical protein